MIINFLDLILKKELITIQEVSQQNQQSMKPNITFQHEDQTKLFQQKYSSPYCHHIVSIYHKEDPIPAYAGNLFLSGVQGLKKDVVRDYGISAVLTIMDKWTYEYDDMDNRIQQLNLLGYHKWIDLQDDLESSIYEVIADSLAWIDLNLKKKNVLVHCHMGMSRSASIVLAFLMKNYNLTLDEAFNHTINIRKTINPNDKFRTQLQNYEKHLQIIKP